MEFDSLADVISFGIAPAILSFAWGLSSLGRLGWAAGFMFLARAAMRLARFNIQSAAAATSAISSGCRAPPRQRCRPRPSSRTHGGCTTTARRSRRSLMVLVPALLMVSTIRFRSFKTIDLQTRQPYRVLLLIAGGIILIAWLHRYVLVVMAYSYLASGFVELAITRFRHRGGRLPPVEPPTIPLRGSRLKLPSNRAR